jgi:YidC/Oxa1 family membrane protein insertase
MFNTFLYQPLYNGFVYLVSVMPFYDVGLAIIILTILVKLVLFPLSHKQSKSQAKMKQIEPHIQAIKEKHKNDKLQQNQKIMELYKEHNINPLAGCLPVLVQLPIIIALYFVFMNGLKDGVVDATKLYSFMHPIPLNIMFLGFVDLMSKNWVLALLAGATQFYQMKLAMPVAKKPEPSKDGELNFKDEFAKNMSMQMQYMLPVMITYFAWILSAAIALYFVVGNIFGIFQELIIKKQMKAQHDIDIRTPKH